MRAVVVEAFGPVTSAGVKDVPDLKPGPGEVIVAPVAIGVNFPDRLVIEGLYQFKPPLPFTPGKEAAGHVVAVGQGVENLAAGDRVLAQVEYGSYAEQVRAKATECIPLPDDVPFEDAASLGLVYQTAWFALNERGGFEPGKRVLVTGASGGVGIAAIQLASALGGHVVAGIGRPENADIVRAAGAEAVVDTGADDLRDSLRGQVREATGGKGVDVIVEMVGGKVFEAALRTLAWSGTLVVVGFASGEIPSVKANYLLIKNISVTGLQWSDYRERTPELMASAQAEIFRLYSAGKVKPVIQHRLPLDGFADALGMLSDRKVTGKVVLTTGRADQFRG